MRKFIMLAVLVLCTAVTAKAQIAPHAEVFGGYSYMRYNPTGVDVNLNGWDASVNFKLLPVLGIVGDFAGDYGSPGGISSSVHTYMAGPQVSLPSRVSPFAHILFGGAHLSVSGETDNSYAMEFGGGIDLHATHNFGFRLFAREQGISRSSLSVSWRDLPGKAARKVK